MSFGAKENPRLDIMSDCPVSLLSFHLDQLLSLSLYFMTLTFLKTATCFFWIMSPNSGVPAVSS